MLSAGWAAVTIALAEGDARSFRASYVSDALGDLVRATCRVATAEHSVAVVDFHGEPEVTRLDLRRTGGRSLRVELSRSASPAGKPFSTLRIVAVDIDDFVDAVRVACGNVDRALYARSWPQHPFPSATLARLIGRG